MSQEKKMKSKKLPSKLSLPPRENPFTSTSNVIVRDDDLLLNQRGSCSISEENESPVDSEFSLDDLETVKVIGKGSGGVVHLVRHKWRGNLFALKVMHMNMKREDMCKQNVQQLKIHQAVKCSHVVVCYRSFYRTGKVYLLLEYMDRGSLADVVRQVKTITEPYLAAMCKQVLQGLVYLHREKNVIHRGIKPSNLLVNSKGEVKITDFGVSASCWKICDKR